MYFFYSKNDKEKEPIGKIGDDIGTRLSAAKYFAMLKNMTLKRFLSVFSVNKTTQ